MTDGEEPNHSSALYQTHSRGTIGLRMNHLYKESQLIRFLSVTSVASFPCGECGLLC